jgi:hypothetical protein
MEGDDEVPAQLPEELLEALAASKDPQLKRSVNQAAVGAGFEPPGGEGLRGGAGHAWLPRGAGRTRRRLSASWSCCSCSTSSGN